MGDWTDEIDFLVRKLGKTAKGAARAIRSALDDDPFEILAYRGYGDGHRAWMHGRVVERRSVGPSTESDHILRNLLNTWRRADSDPLPHAGVTVGYGERSA